MTTQPATPRKRGRSARGICKTRCAGDNLCVGCQEIRHEIHTCKDVSCICHEILRESNGGVAK
jgi:hypothetical protein